MKKMHSQLNDSGWSIVVIAFLNLILVFCVIFVLHQHANPRFGVNVQLASTHFIMGMIDREQSRTLTITAGDHPSFFIGTKAINQSWKGLDQALNELQGEHSSQLTIIIVADAAVSAGNVQRCIDLILSHGFNCSIAARPSLN